MTIAKYKIGVEEIRRIKKRDDLLDKDIYLDMGIEESSFHRYMILGFTSTRSHYEKINLWIMNNKFALNKENKISFYEKGKRWQNDN